MRDFAMSGSDRLLAGLTDEQREAVTTDVTPLLVVAGAGSGKTRVLTRRIAWQAAHATLDPRRVLAVTFTRKAAAELQERLRALGLDEHVRAGTFHALALAQLRRRWLDEGRRAPKVLDRKTRVLARLLGRGAAAVAGAVAREIEWAQARVVSPETYEHEARQARRAPPLPPGEIASVYGRYVEEKRRRGLVDFDDLLHDCAQVIEEDPEVAAAVRWRHRHVYVDEFQDVNAAQFRLLRAWLGDRPDLFAVGDDDQAIYGFSGADAHYLTAFTEHFGPDATVLRLTANFRSTPEILALANAVNRPSPNDARRLRATTVEGPRPSLTAYDDERAEADAVAASIERLRTEGVHHRAVGVLARTNAQCAVIEEALASRRIPARRRGATRFLDEPHIAAALSALEQAADPSGLPFETALGEVTETTDHRPAVSVLRELGAEYSLVEGEAATGAGFRDFVAASVRDEDPVRAIDAVDVLTFHRAKGLEWGVVFVVGLEDGFVPIAHASTEAARSEERRLLHVAFTRAERHLHLSWARRRTFGDTVSDRELSPFLTGVAPYLDAAQPAARGPEPVTDHGRAVLAETASRLRESGPGLRPPPDPLLDALREWRDGRARAAGVPAAAVLDDTTLRAISHRRPLDVDDLVDLPGVGAARVARYGPEIIDLVEDYAEG